MFIFYETQPFTLNPVCKKFIWHNITGTNTCIYTIFGNYNKTIIFCWFHDDETVRCIKRTDFWDTYTDNIATFANLFCLSRLQYCVTHVSRRQLGWWRWVNVIMLSLKRYWWSTGGGAFTKQRVASAPWAKWVSVHRLIQISSVKVLLWLIGDTRGQVAGVMTNPLLRGVLCLVMLPVVSLSNLRGTLSTGWCMINLWLRWGCWSARWGCVTHCCQFSLGEKPLSSCNKCDQFPISHQYCWVC